MALEHAKLANATPTDTVSKTSTFNSNTRKCARRKAVDKEQPSPINFGMPCGDAVPSSAAIKALKIQTFVFFNCHLFLPLLL